MINIDNILTEAILENGTYKYAEAFRLIRLYAEPHRYYHTWKHIKTMLDRSEELGIASDRLSLAILFHDIIYDPRSSTNEEDSANLFKSYIDDSEIYQAILDTKTHKPSSKLSEDLIRLDLEVLQSDLGTFMEFEEGIFKEYQFIDYKAYKEKRIEVLTKLGTKQENIDYVANRKPKIGLYAGSFNPFHKGHWNILQKAEQIFDKVIVAKGCNPDKDNEVLYDFPKSLFYHQTRTYTGLLTDFIDRLSYEVTLIRGLRDSKDLDYELTQYRFLQDLKKDIKVVNIFCDREFNHISSSAIRTLQKYGKGEEYLA